MFIVVGIITIRISLSTIYNTVYSTKLLTATMEIYLIGLSVKLCGILKFLRIHFNMGQAYPTILKVELSVNLCEHRGLVWFL